MALAKDLSTALAGVDLPTKKALLLHYLERSEKLHDRAEELKRERGTGLTDGDNNYRIMLAGRAVGYRVMAERIRQPGAVCIMGHEARMKLSAYFTEMAAEAERTETPRGRFEKFIDKALERGETIRALRLEERKRNALPSKEYFAKAGEESANSMTAKSLSRMIEREEALMKALNSDND